MRRFRPADPNEPYFPSFYVLLVVLVVVVVVVLTSREWKAGSAGNKRNPFINPAPNDDPTRTPNHSSRRRPRELQFGGK